MHVTESISSQTPDVVRYGPGLQYVTDSLTWPPSSAGESKA